MSTTPLTDSINALTAYCNEVDGGTDTTLSDAVYTLAQGFGAGTPTGMEIIEFTGVYNAEQKVAHTLGAPPDLICIMPVDKPSGGGADNWVCYIGVSLTKSGTASGYPYALARVEALSSNDTAYSGISMNGLGWTADNDYVYIMDRYRFHDNTNYYLMAFTYTA